MELIKDQNAFINENGAQITPYLLPASVDTISVVEVIVGIKGHGCTKSTQADRIIKIIEGKGILKVGNDSLSVSPGSIYYVPKNTFYDYIATRGILKVIVFDVPKFNPQFEVTKK